MNGGQFVGLMRELSTFFNPHLSLCLLDFLPILAARGVVCGAAKRGKPVFFAGRLIYDITHTLREIIDPRIHQATKLSPATVAESASNSPRNRARNADDGGATRRRYSAKGGTNPAASKKTTAYPANNT